MGGNENRRLHSSMSRVPVILRICELQMELVEEAVPQRAQKDGNRTEEGHPAEQSVEGGEQFPGDGVELTHRSHSAQDHRRVQEGVQPGKPFAKVVSDNAQQQLLLDLDARFLVGRPTRQPEYQAMASACIWGEHPMESGQAHL